MLEGAQELAENKLLLLYIFNKANMPISNNQITEIILENNLLNYFNLQQYLFDLVESGFLNNIKEERRQLYTITSKGKNALEYFENRINSNKKKIIDLFFNQQAGFIKERYKATADYFPDDENYTVICRLIEDNKILIDIKLNIPSIEKAKHICEKWKNNASKIYSEMINMLTD